MKILFDINHPADVHQFKHLIKELKSNKHKVLVTARDKECTHDLLRAEKISFVPRKGYYGIVGKIFGMFLIDLFLLKQAKKFQPNLLIGSSGNCYIAQVSRLIGKPSFIFDDTEHSKLQNSLTFPFATKIITPNCYLLDLGKKQIKYNGLKELAYLSPKYFKPNKNVLKKYKIQGKFFVLRLVSWSASHDIGFKGINVAKLVEELESKGQILISSELKLPKRFHKYLIKSPNDLHHLLYFADLFIGEGASTAAEAALLGTPSIYLNPLKLGYIDELKGYKLIFHFTDESKALKKAIELIDKNAKAQWQNKKEKLLKEKIDVNEWMYNLIVNQ